MVLSQVPDIVLTLFGPSRYIVMDGVRGKGLAPLNLYRVMELDLTSKLSKVDGLGWMCGLVVGLIENKMGG